MNSAIDRLRHRLFHGNRFAARDNESIHKLNVVGVVKTARSTVIPTRTQKALDVSERDRPYAQI